MSNKINELLKMLSFTSLYYELLVSPVSSTQFFSFHSAQSTVSQQSHSIATSRVDLHYTVVLVVKIIDMITKSKV